MTEGILVQFGLPESDDDELEALVARLEEELAAEDETRRVLEDRSARELAWFCGELGGKVPEQGAIHARLRRYAETIGGWLGAMPAAHRDVLARMFTPGSWPDAIERRFGSLAGVVVGLESATHRHDGEASTEDASVLRLEFMIGARDPRVGRLAERAALHEEMAIRAYLLVRGNSHALCPSKSLLAAIARLDARAARDAALAAVTGAECAVPANDVEAGDVKAGDVAPHAPPAASTPANDVELEGPASVNGGAS
jgi:hypothetical protein